MKNNILFIMSICLLIGCKAQNPAAQQQQEVCKTLSHGYLKIQNQDEYQFWRLEKIVTQAQQNTLKLTYKQPTESGVMMSSLLLPTVEFVCTQQQQQIKVAVQQPTGQLVQVLELKLAETAIGKPQSHDLVAQSKTQ
ncbi:hypothetical protein [Acinetobacter tjernbergiae]|uniref:Lipoprotein n=1 Tax=Acinetobacter tjernbergiae DSM 14971 = CIP 107465 TaxID=1120928 RepID=V2V4C5_9GAMM|nr:hypothetical protein [Acinetobacter tjernbergiae]ESK55736.1 hypothetical protein F990_01620 [Acinetobacter tjernbergiae DSM 14971 = CIP 107465]